MIKASPVPMPSWMKSPKVFCVLLPPGDADDVERANEYMDTAGVRGRYEIMPTTDSRYPEAVEHTLLGLRESDVPHRVISRNHGSLVVTLGKQRRMSVYRIRVLLLQSAAAPASLPA